MTLLIPIAVSSWEPEDTVHPKATSLLESGNVLFLPELAFKLEAKELHLLNPDIVDKKSKNVSFNYHTQKLRAANNADHAILAGMMHRFAESAKQIVTRLLPRYQKCLEIGRTSLRTVEAADRKSPSYRKDDRRLHIDAFPATPNQGRRLLRVFTNINPEGKPRIWRLGEPFDKVAQKFLPQISAPLPGSAWFLEKLRITKSRRTAYDHYMLQIHDRMKADVQYQQSVQYEQVELPPNSTWIVFTDQVTHAVIAGQHLLEQTFYLPVTAMESPELSPLKVLESKIRSTLI